MPAQIPNISPDPDINLIPQKSFEEQPTSKKIYLWMVGVGRVIVIITELVAVLVWLSRFRLDYEITTLQENIEEKAALVAASNRFEEDLRKYQTKVSLTKEIQKNKKSFSTGLTKLAQFTPSGIIVSEIRWEGEAIYFQALSTNSIDFATLITTLTKSQAVKNVILSNTTYDHSRGEYLFNLVINTNENMYKSL